jgi:micrococcal nuclease
VVTVALPASLLALTVLLNVLLVPITGDGDRPPAPPGATVTLPAIFRQIDPDTLTRARVVRVIDGDTIDVVLGGEVERVRYYGVDTPEENQRCYDEARRRNRDLVVVGEDVLLLADARERDQYGRLLRYVFTSAGVLVDASLVAGGFGVAWREDGTYRDALVDLETETRELDIGCLWGRE